MPSICLNFHAHLPTRINPYQAFDIGRHLDYFDEKKNKETLSHLSKYCFGPANQYLLRLIDRHKGRFKVSYSISGILLNRLEQFQKSVLSSFQELAKTGCVEFLAEPYAHSLSFVYSRAEFDRQLKAHSQKIQDLFGQKPKVFRNTALLYHNQLAYVLHQKGYTGCLTEGRALNLKHAHPNQLFSPYHIPDFSVMVRNYGLSDLISLKFREMKLRAPDFANSVHSQHGPLVCLGLDYATFGGFLSAEDGIWDFLERLPSALLAEPNWDFVLPTEALERYDAKQKIDAPDFVSQADASKDLSAWSANPMQQEALTKLYALEKIVQETQQAELKQIWQKLQSAEHFYYMSTKDGMDGALHQFSNPFDSPHSAYLAYMNILADFQLKLQHAHSG